MGQKWFCDPSTQAITWPCLAKRRGARIGGRCLLLPGVRLTMHGVLPASPGARGRGAQHADTGPPTSLTGLAVRLSQHV